MALSDMRAKVQQRREELAKIRVERARQAAQNLMNSDQFKLTAIAMPDAAMAVDALITNTIEQVFNTKAEFQDTLRAKGFRQAEIRKIVHKMYDMYCRTLDDDSNKQVLYEDMLEPVADYFYEHQELYNTLDPDNMRSS